MDIWDNRCASLIEFGTNTAAVANLRFRWHCLPVVITFRGNEVDYREHLNNAHHRSSCIKRKFSAPDIKARRNSKCAAE